MPTVGQYSILSTFLMIGLVIAIVVVIIILVQRDGQGDLGNSPNEFPLPKKSQNGKTSTYNRALKLEPSDFMNEMNMVDFAGYDPTQGKIKYASRTQSYNQWYCDGGFRGDHLVYDTFDNDPNYWCSETGGNCPPGVTANCKQGSSGVSTDPDCPKYPCWGAWNDLVNVSPCSSGQSGCVDNTLQMAIGTAPWQLYNPADNAPGPSIAPKIPNKSKLAQKISLPYEGRWAPRLESRYIFNGGLFVMDIVNIPFGKSVWPAWWFTSADVTPWTKQDGASYGFGGRPWPRFGEIDVIEVINDEPYVFSTLHNRGDHCGGIAMGPTDANQDSACKQWPPPLPNCWATIKFNYMDLLLAPSGGLASTYYDPNKSGINIPRGRNPGNLIVRREEVNGAVRVDIPQRRPHPVTIVTKV